uniref:Uncharacterized protein n=1 Tax=Physcomitrium patens TaxID=3218 RepID=A0A2K1KE45_PHYPA|nr:hypothetical protein PHYPA_008427 [Physcomitrium patens]
MMLHTKNKSKKLKTTWYPPQLHKQHYFYNFNCKLPNSMPNNLAMLLPKIYFNSM